MRFPDLRLRTLGWHVLPMFLIVGSLFIGLPLVVVGVTQRVPAAELFFAGGIIILAMCSWANWRLLRTMYDRGMVDLVRNSRSSSEELLQRYDNAELRRRMFEDLRRKHGWFWGLRPQNDTGHGQ